ncbi:MAG TPA: hypothetical protein VMM56_10510 [Planctomycetaceae bacterium]|nr:hypothetical protein [Planctomycetaceae bacterium]
MTDHTDELPAAPGTTNFTGQTTDEGKGRIFPCERCGADLTFHIGDQKLKCPYCGYAKDIELDPEVEIKEQDFHAMLAHLVEQHEHRTEPDSDVNEVRCDSCGGTVVFTGTLTSSSCPYCASPIQRDDVHRAKHRVPVDAVLPFLIDRDLALKNLDDWVQSRWFAPNDFLKNRLEGTFNGVYLPYWTFDSLTFSVYAGQRGEYYYVTVGTGKDQRRERRTRWYSASGQFQRFFDDVLVTASRGLPRNILESLEPWPLHKCLPFTQEVLAGYFARTYDVELNEGFVIGKQRIDVELDRDVRSRIGGDTQQVHSIETRYDGLTFKHVLLPLWLLAYQYKEKSYQVFINAGTGKVQGERPYSWVKITLTVLGVAAAIGGIILLTQS